MHHALHQKTLRIPLLQDVGASLQFTEGADTGPEMLKESAACRRGAALPSRRAASPSQGIRLATLHPLRFPQWPLCRSRGPRVCARRPGVSCWPPARVCETRRPLSPLMASTSASMHGPLFHARAAVACTGSGFGNWTLNLEEDQCRGTWGSSGS